MSNNNGYLNKTEFAKSLKLSPSTLNRYLKTIGVPAFRGLLCPKMQVALKEKLEEHGLAKLNPKD
jgi:DNA-binding MurR/RpiR family transcriptional regulator